MNDIVARSAALGIHVISLSLGGPASSVLKSAVDLAASKGILVVAAAGNDGNATVQYPAGYDSAVSVAATDRNDAHASFSNTNDKVEISAPGVDIVSTVPASIIAGGYGVWSGTSMATPHVAAVAALLSWKRGLVGSPLRSAVDAATDDLGPLGRDPTFGYGRINLCKAMGGCGAGATPSPTVSPTPTVSPSPSPSAAATPTPVPTPVPVQKGTLTGRAYRSGAARSGVTVSYSGPANGSVKTASTGGYSVSLPPGRYKVTATFGGRACRAGSTSGPTSVSPGVTSGATTTIYWYC
jgi:subtilisin family serine protease